MRLRSVVLFFILISGSSNGQSTLEGTEYADGFAFTSSESYGDAWTYKFGKKEYKLYLYYHYESPKTYLIEQGSYVQNQAEVVLTPKTRLICKNGWAGRHDCGRNGGYHDGFKVKRNTLSEPEIRELGFAERKCTLFIEDGKQSFSDPSKYFRFSRVTRE